MKQAMGEVNLLGVPVLKSKRSHRMISHSLSLSWKGIILEWLTWCSLPYSTTAGWEAKSKNPEGHSPWGWMSQQVFSRRWNHRQARNDAREVLPLAIQERPSRQCENLHGLCSYIGLKMKVWPKLKVSVPDSICGLKVSVFCLAWQLRPLIQTLWEWIKRVDLSE